METCRHFRYQVPRAEADELRDSDPNPCPVCDALPHRQQLFVAVDPRMQTSERPVHARVKGGWLNQLRFRVRNRHSCLGAGAHPVLSTSIAAARKA